LMPGVVGTEYNNTTLKFRKLLLQEFLVIFQFLSSFARVKVLVRTIHNPLNECSMNIFFWQQLSSSAPLSLSVSGRFMSPHNRYGMLNT